MRESDPAPPAAALWLLIGNSRWHWACGQPGRLRCWSEEPPQTGHRPEALEAGHPLRGWGAVGGWSQAAPWLEESLRLDSRAVPLADLPTWVGLDRALVGWQAWRCTRGPVLVADLGTALSFTRVDGAGRFAGGRIQAGRALQLRALARDTALLPEVAGPRDRPLSTDEPWPKETAAALEQGVCEGLVAAVAHAWRQVRREQPDCRLWITGGDGAWLARCLQQPCHPELALEALAALSSGADR